MVINFGALTPVFCLSSFLPSIIHEIYNDKDIATAQLLTVPPCIVACFVAILFSWNAGRVNERSNHLMISLLIGMTGFLYLILADKPLYIGAFIICIGVFSSYALIPSWVTNNIVGETKRAVAVALLTASGSIGGIVSGQIYHPLDPTSYRLGHYIIIGIMGFTFVLVLIMKIVLKYENKRRKKLNADERTREIEAGGGAWLLDKVNFVYITTFF
jgi:cyanate permease